MGKLKVLDLFSGIGGFSLGLEATGGFETVAFCEIDPFCQKVLRKHWPDVPIYEDVRNYDAEDYERPNLITAGFPCQDLSIAGERRGLDGERSGLWTEAYRVVSDVRPQFVVLENVTNLLAGPIEQPGGWFGRILTDLAEIGYDAEWHCIPMSACGAPHQRDRVFVIAYPGCAGFQGPIVTREGLRLTERTSSAEFGDRIISCGPEWRELGAYLRVGDGLLRWSHQIKALGNAVSPYIAERLGQAILSTQESKEP